MMPSLSKVAVSSMPSIYDYTMEKKKIWAPFHPQPKQLNSVTMRFTTDFSKKDCGASADPNSSTTLQTTAKAAWKTSGCLTVSDYQPLDVFSPTAEDPGSASWSEAEEMCDVLIRKKEVELCNMMEETSGIPECE